MNKEFWRNKKVLITGHTGFKGSWLSFILHAFGAKVTGVALPSRTTPSLFDLLNLKNEIDSIICDICNYEKLNKIITQVKPDIVFHMAAQPLVKYSYENPIETYATNVMGTVHVLNSLRKVENTKVIINVTSDKCYDNQEWLWAFRENERLGGRDPYSNSKACAEMVTNAFRQSYFANETSTCFKALATVRAGNVIGGGDWAENRLITDIVNAISSQEKLVLRNPNAVRPWQHVLEPLMGYCQLAEKLWSEPTTYNGAWNFGPTAHDVKPVLWVADYLLQYWGSKESSEQDNEQHPHEAQQLRLDISKAINMLGWRPRWSLDVALNRVVDWYKAWQDQEDMRQVTLNQITDYLNTEA